MIDRYRKYTVELKDFIRWSKEARGVVFINIAEARELYHAYLADRYISRQPRGISPLQNVLDKIKELENGK